jgi:hypothetical protein
MRVDIGFDDGIIVREQGEPGRTHHHVRRFGQSARLDLLALTV